ncbi:conserved hypothetical protein [Theileria orientalis strain Shintoku]|uniref:Uncharacterized protein n=1 Tax=Theileria orientalis strain Shintoku TaxID=869250 RepID=J4CDJ2_THEOR|nr:conserved hypothetical protein [Theileria orientalis strain Shintoku]BAM41237.1 conserved hypothetical protein [Theileria orientalis strain Shintoku]|eukprot:XP_009691538.1 conserved hypothetical protein [Theileria orientalis strain Shintoku]
MIFTFGPPDIYVLPKDVSNSTHGSEDVESKESLKEEVDYEILCVKISYCNSYIFILTKRELWAYSNGSEFVYLGRLRLSELQVSEFETFRDLVILPVNNLIGLVVDNQKHLLIVNYQNPNVNDGTLSNTPIQSPTSKGASTSVGVQLNAATATLNVAASTVGSEKTISSPMCTTSVATIVNNRLLGSSNLSSKLTRILSPMEDEKVGDLKETFFLYLKNFLNFRVVYHIRVPSDFSFMFVVNQQFFFWTEDPSGFYATVSEEGFLNMLINHFNSLKRNDEECRRIDLYLVTTNMLNNVNIVGNIHLSYGLCYINLHRGGLDGHMYKNMALQNENDSLFSLIYSCIGNINNTRPHKIGGRTGSKEEVSQNEEAEEEKARSINANSILQMLEMNSSGPEEVVEDTSEREEILNETEEKVLSDIDSCFIVNNYLFLLSRSHVLLYLHIQSPNDAIDLRNFSEDGSFSSSFSKDEEERDDDKGGDEDSADSEKELKELGRILFINVENIFISKKHNLLCVLFRNNVIGTYHLKCIDRPISVLEISESVEDVSWLDTSLLVLTCEGKVHFYTYALQLLHITCLNIKKSTRRQENGGSSTPRMSTYNVSNAVDASDKSGDSAVGEGVSTSVNVSANANGNSNNSSGTVGMDGDYNNSTESTITDVNGGNTAVIENDNNSSASNIESKVMSVANEKRENGQEDLERRHWKVKSGLLMSINNNRKLLILKSGNLMISHPYIDYGGNSDFHVFLNNNNMLILVNKDMITLRLPNLNHVHNEEGDDDEERPHRIQIVKNIKINNTGNYILIHHTTSGVDETGGLILFNNNKYTYANSNVNTNDIVRVNWFTNHIFYTITYPGWSKKAYKVKFYSINDTNEALIEVESKSRPVCTCKEAPYLFILLDEENKLHCYDLFFINFKEEYRFSISDLKKYRGDEGENDGSDDMNGNDYSDHRDDWIEMYVLGNRKFLLLNGYRQLYVVSEEYIEHVVDDVNQVVINSRSSNNNSNVAVSTGNSNNNSSGNGQYEYVVTTNDKTYVVYNHGDTSAEEYLGMYEVKTAANRNYILSLNDNIAFTLNTSAGIDVNYALMPTFALKRKVNSRKHYLIYYLNLAHRDHTKKSVEKKKLLMRKLTRKTRNKIFAIFSRKNNELEKINEQEDEFGIKCEECFDYLLEKEEYEYASLLLLPIQTKTNPYKVRSDQCKKLVRKMLMSIIDSTPQKGRKSREKNKALLQMLVKFYHRLPDVRSMDEEVATSLSQQDLSKNEDAGTPPSKEKEGDDSTSNVEEVDVNGAPAGQLKVDDSEYDNVQADGGIDAIVDMKELVDSLQSKLNFMAIYKLSFLSRMGIGSEYLIRDTSKPEEGLNSSEHSAGVDVDADAGADADANAGAVVNANAGAVVNAGADAVAGAETTSSAEALQPMELNTILYFITEFNHINCKILTHAGHRKCHYNSFVAGEKTQCYMLMGYRSYIGLSSLLLRNEAIYEYVKSIGDEAEAEGTEDPGDRLSLLRSLLSSIKRTYTRS